MCAPRSAQTGTDGDDPVDSRRQGATAFVREHAEAAREPPDRAPTPEPAGTSGAGDRHGEVPGHVDATTGHVPDRKDTGAPGPHRAPRSLAGRPTPAYR